MQPNPLTGSELGQVVDAHEIREALAQYCRALDRRDGDAAKAEEDKRNKAREKEYESANAPQTAGGPDLFR